MNRFCALLLCLALGVLLPSCTAAVNVNSNFSSNEVSMYRGVIEDFAVSDDGKTVALLRRAPGTRFAESMKVKLGGDAPQLGNGAYIQVTYSGENDDGTVTADTVEDLGPAELVNYNGMLVSVTRDGDGGQLLLDPLDEGGMACVFRFDSDTVFHAALDSLEPGDRLNVYHSAVSTRSLPPQSAAFEVSEYLGPAD